MGMGNLLAQRIDHLVEPRADRGVRNAGLLGDLFEIASGEDKDFNESLVFGGQIREPRAGKLGLDRNIAASASSTQRRALRRPAPRMRSARTSAAMSSAM